MSYPRLSLQVMKWIQEDLGPDFAAYEFWHPKKSEAPFRRHRDFLVRVSFVQNGEQDVSYTAAYKFKRGNYILVDHIGLTRVSPAAGSDPHAAGGLGRRLSFASASQWGTRDADVFRASHDLGDQLVAGFRKGSDYKFSYNNKFYRWQLSDDGCLCCCGLCDYADRRLREMKDAKSQDRGPVIALLCVATLAGFGLGGTLYMRADVASGTNQEWQDLVLLGGAVNLLQEIAQRRRAAYILV